jgi:hypothetical protein
VDETPTKSKTSNVGYCQPPEQTRFKPGKSGNPRGRPKGSRNIATVLDRVMKERLEITENGKRKRLTKLEAFFKRLTNQAVSGDPRAMQLFATLLRFAEDGVVAVPPPSENLDETESKVFRDIVERMKACDTGEEENDDKPKTK